MMIQQPLRMFDRFLNNLTMYRLLVYGLGLLLGGAIILHFFHQQNFSAAAILATLATLIVSCYVANRAFATLFEVSTNSESWLITALILCCILTPTTGVHRLALVALAGAVAMASKFLLVIHHKHLFNPAAVAAVILGLTKVLPAIWWVGSPAMLPLTALFGIFILRKIRRFQMFFSFFVISMVVAEIVGLTLHQSSGTALRLALTSSPLIFLGTVMLTEPETAPVLNWQLLVFGGAVGALFASHLNLGFSTITPEMALIAGNIFAFVVSPQYRLRLRLVSKKEIGPGIYDFRFATDHPFHFQPGQYLEWTLGHSRPDRRGNRRTFSIASAPEAEHVGLALKLSNPSSSYKTALLALEPGKQIIAGQLAGNFLLPKDLNQKLVFIAGGIGITPFVSMAEHMTKAKEHRDVVLFYFVNDPAEVCYPEIWDTAKAYGLLLIPVLSGAARNGWDGEVGRLDKHMLERLVPDYAERRFYLSGPNALVENYAILLRRSGVNTRQIVKDHFSGY